MPKESSAKHKINPKGRSQWALKAAELPAFFAAQRNYFQLRLESAHKRQFDPQKLGPLSLFLGPGMDFDVNSLGVAACLFPGAFLFLHGLEEERGFFTLLGGLLVLASIYFALQWMLARIRGERSVEACQREIGRNLFLESFFQALKSHMAPNSLIRGEISHEPLLKQAYSPQDSDPVAKIHPWAVIDFEINTAQKLQLSCTTLAPRPYVQFDDNSHFEGLHFEISGSALQEPLIHRVETPGRYYLEYRERETPYLLNAGESEGLKLAARLRQSLSL